MKPPSDDAAPAEAVPSRTDVRSPGPDPLRPDREGTQQRAFALIASGMVRSRGELREQLAVSASTASGIVNRLIREGLVSESGVGTSTGGRPPRVLRALESQDILATAELGARHARIGLVSVVGAVLAVDELEISLEHGPEAVLDQVAAGWRALLEADPAVGEVRAAGIGLPGPVDASSGALVAPARMPGWHDAHVRDIMTQRLGVPVAVENDARAGALGELALDSRVEDFLYVKAGNGIGAAYVSAGRLVTGANGVAGDITHVPVAGAEDRPCACGRTGCLETVASGRAIRQELAGIGLEVPSMAELVALALDFQPEATSAMRRSGQHVGRVIAHLVNFLNPAGVLIGGSLSEVDAFIAAVRSSLYDSALAMTTQSLTIGSAAGGADSALIGLAGLADRARGAR